MKLNVSNATGFARRKYQKALTLVELLIVLFILAAVAGVTIGIVPNFQKRTHGATSASSIRAGESAIFASLITGGTLGDEFDGLITAGGNISGFVANSNGLEAQVLDADMADSLNELGITTVYPSLTDAGLGDENATLDGHDYTATISVATGEELASLTAGAITQIEDDFNLTTGQFDEIFAFGLGEESTLVGLNAAFKEAPLHTPGEGSAASQYSRYAVLVGYDDGGGEPEATYIGVTCIDDGENFNNINANLGEFFEANE